MRDTIRGEDHAVAAARLDGHWLTLDNRRMAMVEDAQVRNYRPIFVIDQHGVMQYVDAPLLAGLPGADPALANLARRILLRWISHRRQRSNAEPGLISPSN